MIDNGNVRTPYGSGNIKMETKTIEINKGEIHKITYKGVLFVLVN